ncbi:ABC transporter permease subunit [Mesobacillus maritimus]|uniref:ABC transporter permease subunit n=1 Tax=Mesobacillus maritimus TaxID=1643336 RepID=UPI00203FB3EA|nr:ABC transporter permease subunit [Mesobacillus maritimus]MCM3584503.1 ABC transporter permease subunit [Mesobacillus maritimus]MCM3670764.1 ABC transporter permease subunit [Mesobacillus maritimus]
MNKRILKAMIKKDLRDIYRTNTLLTTIIVIPIVFSVLFPTLLVGSSLLFDIEKAVGNDVEKMLSMFLSQTNNEQTFTNIEQQIVYLFINYLLPSLFLLVPIITASVVAANSFVGEKERRTLESLLFSPVSIKTLFLSKTIASFIPSLLVSVTSFILCGIIINGLGYQLFGEIIFPSSNWVALIICLSPMVILFTVLLNLYISSRVKTYQEAQNMSGIIVLPVIALIVGQVSGLFLVGAKLTLIIAAVILVVNVVLLLRITKLSDRHILFEKQIH